MQRLFSAILFAGVLLLLGGCGGGAKSTPTPQNGGNNGGATGDQPSGGISPAIVHGSATSGVLPNMVNVQTTADDATLKATLAKFGYSLVRHHGEFATVRVPGGSLDQAIATLDKEFTIFNTSKVNVFTTPNVVSRHGPFVKSASYIPLDPMSGEKFEAIGFDGTNFGMFIWSGEGWPLASMSFPGAWDTATTATVSSIPVKVAVIDAGFQDYSAPTGEEDVDTTIIDAAQSGSVDGAGTFTAGLSAAAWTTAAVDIGGGTFAIQPLRDTGGEIFTLLACTRNSRTIRANDFDQGGTITADEMWSEGIAGLNPSASYILIKTGTAAGQNWTFNDNEIAASIDHAVAAGANIIVLGMAGAGPVGANVSASIAAARAADKLVIAPAGDTVSTYNGTNGFATQPADIQVTPVSPGSDANCMSVAATGFGRHPLLPDQTIGGNTVPDVGNGWNPQISYNPGTGPVQSVFDTIYASVAPYSNYNATIAAMGYGVPQTFHTYLLDAANVGDGSAGNPYLLAQGIHYGGGNFTNPFDTTDFGSQYSTAYVAGAASMVYQALAAANGGTFPADVDTTALTTLVGTSDFGSLDRIDDTLTATPGACPGGYLNANKAINQAFSGGTLFSSPLAFTTLTLSQSPLSAVTINSPLSLTANIANGTGPFSISVDWGDGRGPQVTNNWVPGTLIALDDGSGTPGYHTLGPKALNVVVTDSKSQTVTGTGNVFVINPLTASILVTDQSGAQVALNSLTLATNYIFEVRANNMYTGTWDNDNNPATPEVPNNTVFQWDFDNDGTNDATGAAPVHAYAAPGTYTVKLTSQEDFRPDQTFNIQVTVN